MMGEEKEDDDEDDDEEEEEDCGMFVKTERRLSEEQIITGISDFEKASGARKEDNAVESRKELETGMIKEELSGLLTERMIGDSGSSGMEVVGQ